MKTATTATTTTKKKTTTKKAVTTRSAGIGILVVLATVLVFDPVAWSGTAAAADQTIDETRSAPAEGRVEIECLAGEVKIVGWDRNEVSVQGTLPEEVEFEIRGDGDRTVITAEWPDHSGFMGRRVRAEGDASLQIRVPRGSDVSVETVSAGIDARDLRGELSAESVSGSVTVGPGPARVEAESFSGDVEVLGETDRLTASSVSGAVRIHAGSRDAEVSSVSGSVHLEGKRFGRLEASSVSGDVEFRADLDPSGHYEISSHSGDVEMWVPASASADFEISTFSGDIDSAFGGEPEKTSQFVPAKELSFQVGSGQAQVELNSFSGTVRIHKL